MTTIIVEDEELAAERLVALIGECGAEIEVLEILDSVEETVAWLSANEPPDLAFFDIQLADGLSFDIFKKIKVACPVIFTTAYDEYALQAFKVNSIDYLLKPIEVGELKQAIEKYKSLQKESRHVPLEESVIAQVMGRLSQRHSYKTRFVIRAGHQLLSVPVSETLYFYTEQKVSWLYTKGQKKHALDYTMEQLENALNPQLFFRLNRKYITSFEAIDQITSYSNSRLKVTLKGLAAKEDIVVSREKVAAFKQWLDQ